MNVLLLRPPLLLLPFCRCSWGIFGRCASSSGRCSPASKRFQPSEAATWSCFRLSSDALPCFCCACCACWQATGAAILADLQRQRQQIEHTRQQAQQTDASVAAADGTLKRMGQWWRLW